MEGGVLRVGVDQGVQVPDVLVVVVRGDAAGLGVYPEYPEVLGALGRVALDGVEQLDVDELVVGLVLVPVEELLSGEDVAEGMEMDAVGGAGALKGDLAAELAEVSVLAL